MKIAIIDFDKTLIRNDSVFFLMLKYKWFLKPCLFWSFLQLILTKIIYKSYPEKQLKARSKLKKKLAILFKENFSMIKEVDIPYFRKNINNQLLEQINSEKFDLKIIASASFSSIITQVCEGVLSIDLIIASQTDDFTKEYVTCWNIEKLRRLEEVFPKIWEHETTLYTDSLDDLPLMTKCDNVVKVRI